MCVPVKVCVCGAWLLECVCVGVYLCHSDLGSSEGCHGWVSPAGEERKERKQGDEGEEGADLSVLPGLPAVSPPSPRQCAWHPLPPLAVASLPPSAVLLVVVAVLVLIQLDFPSSKQTWSRRRNRSQGVTVCGLYAVIVTQPCCDRWGETGSAGFIADF